nr:MAG TPA: hypothetical protein [Caudoviricetes sp.]
MLYPVKVFSIILELYSLSTPSKIFSFENLFALSSDHCLKSFKISSLDKDFCSSIKNTIVDKHSNS